MTTSDWKKWEELKLKSELKQMEELALIYEMNTRFQNEDPEEVVKDILKRNKKNNYV